MTSKDHDLFSFSAESHPLRIKEETVQAAEGKSEEIVHKKKNLPIILVDGSGFIFRAYHAVPPMHRPDGIMVNAVYGFCSMLLRVISDYPKNPIAVVFDTSRKTFRTDFYPDYKAHRPPPPDDLVPQFGLIREAVEKFGIRSIEIPGFEADDLIATYAKLSVERGGDCYIVTSDKDMMQLIRPGVVMLDPMKNEEIGLQAVEKRFGVTPDKVCDVQALMGDSSDNVPGVPGIGVKGAAQLVNEYGSLEEILAKASDMKPSKRRDSLIEFAELARISKRLVTLDADIKELPVEFDHISHAEMSLDVVRPWLEEMSFGSLIRRIGSGLKKTTPSFKKETPVVIPQDTSTVQKISDIPYGNYAPATDDNMLSAVLEDAKSLGRLSLSILTREDKSWIGFSWDEGKATAAPLEIVKRSAIFRNLLADLSVLKLGSDIKAIMRFLLENGMGALYPYDDVSVMSYTQSMGKFSQKIAVLSEKYLGHTYQSPDMLTKKQFMSEDFDPVASVAEEADIALRLSNILKPALRQTKNLQLYENVDRPLVNTLAHMEEVGVTIDPQRLKEAGQDFLSSMQHLEKDIFAAAGQDFSINSPKQLGEILFDKMGLPSGKKTKTGAWSTDVNVLEELADNGYDIARNVLDWRKFDKLRSTYTESLAEHISPVTGRLHTTFHMTLTTTGRLSSSNPNLQNIPIRTPEAARIRQSFIAPEGSKILSADYSQIELRILAGVAGVDTLIDAFSKHEDIHRRTAAEVFGMDPSDVDSNTRRKAKAINFGIVYGISAFGLARQLQVSNHEAKSYIDRYFEQYPGIQAYMEKTIQDAQRLGYVTTPFGRKCFVPGLNNKGPARKAAERQAVNAPIQGGAADVIKYAMNNLEHGIKLRNLRTRMVLQVHDELIFEVPDEEVETVKSLVIEKMENAVSFSVPLEVEVGVGQSWEEAH